MRYHYHLPISIIFPDEISGEIRLRLQTIVVASIRRVAEQTANDAQIVAESSGSAEPVREQFTAQRLNPERTAHAVPGYDDGGEPTDVPVKQAGGASVAPPLKLRWRHPHGNVADDQVISGSSPFEDQFVAVFPGWQAVRVHADRYAVTTDLRRAVTWSNLLFGARSYVILEGPTGKASLCYYVIGTTHALHAHDVAQGTGTSIARGEVWGHKHRIYCQPQQHEDQHGYYMLRVLFTAEGQPMWPLSRELVEEFYAELRLGKPQQQVVPKELARPLVFGEIDRLIAAESSAILAEGRQESGRRGGEGSQKDDGRRGIAWEDESRSRE